MKLIIGEPLLNPTETWEVRVHWNWGDMDDVRDTTVQSKSGKDICQYIGWCQSPPDDIGEIISDDIGLSENLIYQWDADELYEAEVIEVYWFDENGIQHTVIVSID